MRIPAISLAEKIQAARQGSAPSFAEQLAREPRTAEILWSIQAASMQPSGLDAFVASLVANYPTHFQSSAMLKAGALDESGRYSLAQCLALWKAASAGEWAGQDLLSGWKSSSAIQRLEILAREALTSVDDDSPAPAFAAADINLDRVGYGDFLSIFVRRETTVDAGGNQARALRKGCERFNFDFLVSQCQSEARRELSEWLVAVCTEKELSLSGTRYCARLPEMLLANLAIIVRENAAQIAETEIARTVRRELEFAITEGVPVPFIGESRYGKTKTVSNWCAMHPGRVRLVTTPNNNSEMAFMRAHAEAFGIEYTGNTKLHSLRDDVEFVLRNSGLAVVYDEAHALVPVGYSKDSPPRRLNWVRSSVIDQGVPCAFFATPQSDLDTLERYAKATGYRLSQWVGRMAPPVILSDVIPVEDIVAIASTQFPELTQAQLEEMADQAILSPGYLKNIEMAGRRARFLARERGHAKPSTQDVLDACTDMMPAAPRVATGAPAEAKTPKRRTAPAVAPALTRGSRMAEAIAPATDQEFPRRSTTPARLINEPVTVG